MNNICYHAHTITRKEKEKANGHKGCVIWLTGLSGSGKSTIANALESMLFKKGCQTLILDGDNVRHGLNSDLDFSPAHRRENVRRIGEAAKLLANNGIIVITALISPFAKDRKKVRKSMKRGDLIEVFLECDINTCVKRDPKGLYHKAKKNKIGDFTGISSPYEKPSASEITIDTSKTKAGECAKMIMRYLTKKRYIR